MEPDLIRRIARVASSRQVAFFRVAAAIDPVARHGAAVVAQLREAGYLFAGGEFFPVFLRYIGHEASIELARDPMRVRMISIVPCELADRLWKHAVLLIGTLYRFGEAV